VGGTAGLFAVTNNGPVASNKWTFFPGEGLLGSPTIGSDGTIYWGGSGNFYAVSSNGLQKWKLPLTNATSLSTPAIGFDGTLYFVASGWLYAVTPLGQIKWQSLVDDTNSTPYLPLSPSVGVDGTIYTGSFFVHKLRAIKPDGTEKWSMTLAGPTSESPAIAGDGTIYIVAGGLYSFAPDGTGLLSGGGTNLGAASPVLGTDGNIYVADNDLALTAVQPNGRTVWRAVPYGVRALPTTATVDAGGTIYYCLSNCVFAITSQGAVEWVFASSYQPPLPNYVTLTSPAIGPDGVIYAAFGRTIYAIAGTNKLSDTPWPMYRQNPRHTGKVEKPLITPPQKRSDGSFDLQLFGQLGDPFTIQASTNLNTWTSLTSFVATTVPMEVVDFTATNFPVRFYRASSP
jgi:hypothetical protein